MSAMLNNTAMYNHGDKYYHRQLRTKTTAGSNDLTWDFYVYNAG
jgi:hypothetical protein